MAAMRAGELRDPTLEELYTGPLRALPDEIQQLGTEDTACTFCGVSYFVFAEVQALQTTVKQYKETFRDVVLLLQQERTESSKLRTEIATCKDQFQEIIATCHHHIKTLAEEKQWQRASTQNVQYQLQETQAHLDDALEKYRQLENNSKRNEEAHILSDQKLRTQITHLFSQVGSYTALSESLQATSKAENAQNHQKIQHLESQLVETQAFNQQLSRECHHHKEQVTALTERLNVEASTTRELQEQRCCTQAEMERLVRTNETERHAMTHNLLQLEEQIQELTAHRDQLLKEIQRQQKEMDDQIKALRLEADELHGQLSVRTLSYEQKRDEHALELEHVREEQQLKLNQLQRNHMKAIETIKTTHDAELETVKAEAAALHIQMEETGRQMIAAMQDKLVDAERQAIEWKDRAMHDTNERENLQRVVQNWQKQLEKSERARAAIESELKSVQDKAEDDIKSVRQAFDETQASLHVEKMALQEQVENLHDQLEALKSQQQQAASPHGINREEEKNEHERILEHLRHHLTQKDREIALLQQTVHRECMERTTLLARVRGVKICPESTVLPLEPSTSLDTSNNAREDEKTMEPPPPFKALVYEKLRRRPRRPPAQK